MNTHAHKQDSATESTLPKSLAEVSGSAEAPSLAKRGMTRRNFLYCTSIGAAMAALANPLVAFADEGKEQSGSTPRGEIEGMFAYDAEKKSTATLDDDGQVCEKFIFNQNFFEYSSFLFNPHLCSFAAGLAFSSFASKKGGSDDYTYKYSNAENFFTQLDCEKGVVVANDDFKKKPGQDTIGLVCAHRPITVSGEQWNLVMLGVRGAGYGLEWTSNLKAGDTNAARDENHQGFSEAAAKAIAFLKSYIKSAKLSGKTKILIAGYSRASATANLAAGGLINEAIDANKDFNEETGYDLSFVFDNQIQIRQCDLYNYGFEVPAGVHAEGDERRTFVRERYRNLFSLINPCDMVPCVMPSQFQFVRYGVDVRVPAPTDGLTWKRAITKMTPCANKVGEKFDPQVVDNFVDVQFFTNWISIVETPKHPDPQNLFLVQFFNALTSQPYINSRKKYFNNFQEVFREAYILNDEMSSEPGYGSFMSDLKDEIGITGGIILVSCIKQNLVSGAKGKLTNYVEKALKKADSKTSGAKLYDTYFNRWKQIIEKLITSESLKFIKQEVIKIAIFAQKASDIISCHLPGMALAWAHAMDSNFIEGTSPYVPKGVDMIDEASTASSNEALALAASADGDSEGSNGSDTASTSSSDTRYRTVVFNGNDLVVWATVEGKDYKLFDCGKLVERTEDELASLPFIYNIDLDMQPCIWLDADTEQKFIVTLPQGTNLRCIETHMDTLQEDPVGVYVYDNLDGFFNCSRYEFTAGKDQLTVYEPYDTSDPDPNKWSWNSESIRGNCFNTNGKVTDNKTMYYTIETAAEPEEAASVCGGGYSKRGERSLVFAFTDEAYEFDYWTLDGERVAADDAYVGSSTYNDTEGVTGREIDTPLYRVFVDADHKVVAHFKKKSSDTEGGGDNSSGTEADKNNGVNGDTDKNAGANADASSTTTKTTKTTKGSLPQTGDALSDAAKLAAGAAAAVGAAAIATQLNEE